jgi:hypothetical protein
MQSGISGLPACGDCFRPCAADAAEPLHVLGTFVFIPGFDMILTYFKLIL